MVQTHEFHPLDRYARLDIEVSSQQRHGPWRHSLVRHPCKTNGERAGRGRLRVRLGRCSARLRPFRRRSPPWKVSVNKRPPTVLRLRFTSESLWTGLCCRCSASFPSTRLPSETTVPPLSRAQGTRANFLQYPLPHTS